ncbi:MAG: DUF2798 domain-containing protein [Moraxellaceae bacterium]
MRKIPARYASLIMPLLLSIFMTCVVSAISILRSTGLSGQFLQLWPGAWLLSWLVAFPVLLLILPVVKRLTVWLTEPA